jgi:RHS repeat-associated protein
MEDSPMSRLRLTSVSLLSLAIGVLLGSPLASGQKIGADPAACLGDSSVCTHHLQTYSFVSLTEGYVAETYSAARVTSAFGPTLMFDLIYNSYNADGTRASVDTGMGYGWTHTYNDFLFTQGTDIFRFRKDGRVTKFSLVNGSYQATPGYFETLVVDTPGSITITDKYQTKYQYQLLASPIVQDSPSLSPSNPFGAVFRLTSITDRNNNVTSLSYPNGQDLKTITDTFGRTFTLAYNANNHLASVTDPLGQVTTFSYDSTESLLMAIKDPLGHTTSYTYNNLKQITTKTDRDARLFTIAYKNNLPYSEVDASGTMVYSLSNTSNWATDPIQLNQNYLRVYIPSTTFRADGRGNIWQYRYESHGFPLAVIAPDGTTTQYTYDPKTLRPASKTDANGDTTLYQYDSEGNLIQVIDANGNITMYTYDPQFNQMTSMTDPQHRVTTYTLDSHGNRLSETDPLGGTRKWTYDSHGNVLTDTDKDGNTTTYTYDSYGNRAQTTDALGEVTKYTYDIMGNMTSMTDANDHTTSYKYDALYRLILVTNALNGTEQYGYDGEGDKILFVDENGNPTKFYYDIRRRLVRTTNALNNSTTNTYDANDNRVSMTDLNGHITVYSFDVQNRLISTKDALGHVSSCTYDGVGNRTSETDANGHTSTYAFDHLNRQVRKTDALGEVTVRSYDLTGLPGCPQCTGPTLGSNKATKQIDANGKILYWAYDGLDQLIINIHKQGGTSYFITPTDAVNRHTYDANSNHTSMTEPDGNTTTYSYDALNRQVQMVNAAGDTTKTGYDPVGNVKSVTYPNLNVTTISYDPDNRPVQQSDSAGNVGTLTFDPAGNITSLADGNGETATITFRYDAVNRVTSMKDPLCNSPARAVCRSTQFLYDAEGNQLSTADRNGNVENYSYDLINRPISVTNSIGNTSQSQYDGVGNLIQMTDGNGHMTTTKYDAVNRPISLTYADPSHNTVTWTYDNVGHVTTRSDQKDQVTTYTYSDLYFVTTRAYFPSGSTDTFTYDLSGRVLTQTHGGWTDTSTYDGANRILISKQNGQTVSYAYNIPGRTRTITYPGGRTITEQMDFRSRISTVNDGGPTPIVQYAFDQANNVLTRAFRNGTVATYTYNPNNWVLSLDHTLGANRFLGFQYAYDDEGNQLVQNKLNDPTDSETFTSNAIYQLTDYKTGVLLNNTIPKPVTQTTYILDPVGNWEKTLTCIPGNCSTQTRTHSPSNEITSINGSPLISDYNGNLTDDGSTLYSYDEENRLVEAVDKSSGHVLGQYQYNASGKRISAIDNFGSQTFYYYDGWRAIEEQSSLGLTEATYVFGNDVDEVLTMDRVLEGGTQTFYYHQNTLHSVFALTNSAGSVVEAYEYDAYGSQTVIVPGHDGVIHYDSRDVRIPSGKSTYGNPFFFTGQRYDAETGLMYYKQRYYSATLGRFMSRDPIGIWADLANIGNGYAYVGDNPDTWTDPYGTRKHKFWNWIRKVADDVKTAAEDIKKAVVNCVESILCITHAISDVKTAIGALNKLAGADLLTPFNWIAQASKWISDQIPGILAVLATPIAQGVFTAAACYNFVTDVVNIAKHGLQPTNIPSFLLGNNGNVNIQNPGGSGSSLTPVQAGDVVTVVSDIATGISCAKGLYTLTLEVAAFF